MFASVTRLRVRSLLYLPEFIWRTFTIATFNSNLASSTARAEGSVTFSHTFDYLHNEYWVELLLTGGDTSGNPVVYMVRVTEVRVFG